jgi:hypothetical protein
MSVRVDYPASNVLAPYYDLSDLAVFLLSQYRTGKIFGKNV